MNLTVYEKGVLAGQRKLLGQLLEAKFGPLPATAVERLQTLPEEELARLGLRYVQAQSLQELRLVD